MMKPKYTAKPKHTEEENVAAVPPEPVKAEHPAPAEVEEGIWFTPHKKTYHAEVKIGGRMINVGNFPTLEAAQSAVAKVKADFNI